MLAETDDSHGAGEPARGHGIALQTGGDTGGISPGEWGCPR